ncbi:MAG: hypothetical protein ACI9FG_000893, partial [Crocinitomicaceae bacterium]
MPIARWSFLGSSLFLLIFLNISCSYLSEPILGWCCLAYCTVCFTVDWNIHLARSLLLIGLLPFFCREAV